MQYFSLGYLERDEMSPNVNREIFLCLKAYSWSYDMSRGQKLKMKEIGELVANLVSMAR